MIDAIEKAAHWLATTPERQRPEHLIPHLRETFGLSAVEAVQAIRESHLIKRIASDRGRFESHKEWLERKKREAKEKPSE